MKPTKKLTPYQEKLLDPRWQKKRLEILQRDEWRCQSCGDKESTLHVHHRLYFPQKDPWEYENDCLVTLCADCHDHERECMPEYIEALSRLLKRLFFADDVFSIFHGVSCLSVIETPQKTADLIEFVLRDDNIMNGLWNLYVSGIEKNEV